MNCINASGVARSSVRVSQSLTAYGASALGCRPVLVVEKVVAIEHGKDIECSLPLHHLSPHETNEWAYYTQPIIRSERRTFREATYAAAWIRIWPDRSGPFRRSKWYSEENSAQVVSLDSDGVVFRLRTVDELQPMIQVGGPKIPWKFVALPTNTEVLVLVRPSPVSGRRTHPLDFVVAASEMDGAALMTLLLSGDAGQAQSLSTDQTRFELAFGGKWRPDKLDYAAEIAFGYFLIRSNDYEGLERWIRGKMNSLQSFRWRGDSAILELWNEIHQLRKMKASTDNAFFTVADRVREFAETGDLPFFAEGLRLLQKVTYLFRDTRKNSAQMERFLGFVNAYIGALDPFAVATTFTGSRPDAPSTRFIYGFPDDGPFEYLFPDVY